MKMIVKLNRKHIPELALVDFESEHENDTKNGITLRQMKEELLSRFALGHEIFFGFKNEDEIVGYVSLKPFFPGFRHCELHWLAVRKMHQHKGIGRELMCFIETYAKKHKFRKIYLYTGKDMKTSRGFYEKLGYKFVNEFPGFYGYIEGNTTAVLYCKDLEI
jgi:ribosomal protein S18 acetylase RimI-like enzyme